MADLAARGYTGVLHTFSENDLAYYRGTLAEIVAASHDAGLPCAGRARGGSAGPSAARRRAAGSRSIPRSARCSTTGAASRPRASTAPAYRAFCKEWADGGARRRCRRRLLGRAGMGRARARRRRRSTSRWTCRCAHCAERFGGSVPGRAAHPRCGPSARRRSSTSCARWSRSSPLRGGREHDLPAPRDRGHAGHLGLEHRRVAARPDDVRHRSVLEALGRAGRPVRAAASRASCARRATGTASAPSSGSRASA